MKKILAVLVCAAMLVASFSVGAAAENTQENNNCPFIFIHGLMGWGEVNKISKIIPYWGTTSGNVINTLKRAGFDVRLATLGSINSVWDQACELYAQLTGTRVDYGAAHAAEHGHSRYGRTYESSICDTFGKKDENGNNLKINLVGYSLGGSVARLFSSILEYGCKEELEAASDASDFFKGGKGSYVNSVSTISAPHNGTVSVNKEESLKINVVFNALYYIFGSIGNSCLRPLWDIQLEQFGLTDSPDFTINGKFSPKLIKKILNSKDCAYYDLTLEGAKRVNEIIETVDDIYYFSFISDCVYESPLTGNIYPDITMNIVMLLATSPEICFYVNEGDGSIADESWRFNDGIVSTESAKHPEDEEYKEFDADNIEKGIWNVMPVIHRMDHTDYMGMFTDPVKVRKFYLYLCENAAAVS